MRRMVTDAGGFCGDVVDSLDHPGVPSTVPIEFLCSMFRKRIIEPYFRWYKFCLVAYCLFRELNLLEFGREVCGAIGNYLFDTSEGGSLRQCTSYVFERLLDNIDWFRVGGFC